MRQLYDYYKDCPINTLSSINSTLLFMMNEAVGEYDMITNEVANFERKMNSAAIAKRLGNTVNMPEPINFGKYQSSRERELKAAQSKLHQYLVDTYFGY